MAIVGGTNEGSPALEILLVANDKVSVQVVLCEATGGLWGLLSRVALPCWAVLSLSCCLMHLLIPEPIRGTCNVLSTCELSATRVGV